MPFFKEVWQYSSSPSGSWNEVFYTEDSDIGVASSFGTAIINRRVKLLHPVNRLEKIRVSDLVVPRVSVIVPVGLQGTATIGTGEGPANLDEAAVIQLGSASVPSSRKLWLRGTAEDSVSRDSVTGRDKLLPAFDADLTSWLDKFCENEQNYVILTRTRPGTAGIVKTRITGVNGALQPGYAVLDSPEDLGLAVGNQIVVNLVDQKEIPGLTGVFQVLDLVGTNPVVAYHVYGNINLTVVPQGYYYKLVYRTGARVNRALCKFAYLGSRRSKKSTTGSRGARRARRLRR